MLEQAVAMSLASETTTPAPTATSGADYSSIYNMTEEEQIAYAMQMSLQQTRNILFTFFVDFCFINVFICEYLQKIVRVKSEHL